MSGDLSGDEVVLVDLLDRLLAGGVVIAGDITIALADIELVHVSLRALISSVDTIEQARTVTPVGPGVP